MATITICDRSKEGKCTRKRITEVSLGRNISDFKDQISKNIECPENSFDVVYCGQCLKEDASLESYGLHSGSTVHLLPRFSNTTAADDKANTPNKEIKSMIKLLQGALKNPAYKSTIEQIFNCPDKLQDIVNAVPELNNNPATLTLFQDQDLLKVLAHPGNVRRLLEAHPCLPTVVQLISDRVTVAGTTGQFTATSTGSYSLDHMSDDDDDDTPGPSGGQAITANQLSAALAAASGTTTVTPSTAQSSHGRPIGNNMITQDFFQQAIQQAQTSSMTSQLEQMREMGINDENVARQALQATNGDLQAALDLLLGGGFS